MLYRCKIYICDDMPYQTHIRFASVIRMPADMTPYWSRRDRGRW